MFLAGELAYATSDDCLRIKTGRFGSAKSDFAAIITDDQQHVCLEFLDTDGNERFQHLMNAVGV